MSDLLPDDLVWTEGGHASDVTLTALADGEGAIVPADAQRHVDTCAHCTQLLGRVALLSLHAGEELSHAHQHSPLVVVEARPAPRFQLPWVWVAAALVIAAVASVPTLLAAPLDISSGTRTALRGMPLALRHIALAVRGAGESHDAMLVMNMGAALLLVVVAAVVARRVVRPQTQGSER